MAMGWLLIDVKVITLRMTLTLWKM